MLLHILATFCLFSPPSDWECVRPENVSSYVQVGFVGKGSTLFSPSINLAIEEVDITLKEYLKAVKKIHTAKPNTTWRDLGKFSMAGGVGRLTEIDAPGAWGRVKMLQAILVKENRAFILTAAVLKKDFPKLQNEILGSLRTMNLIPDLLEPIRDPEKREMFSQIFTNLSQDVSQKQKKKWEDLQKVIENDYSYLGKHWQFLALKEGYAKIYSHSTEKSAKH